MVLSGFGKQRPANQCLSIQLVGRKDFEERDLSPPAGAPIKLIFVRKVHAIHHFHELFELISTM